MVVLALTAVVYALAMWSRLPRDRVNEHIDDGRGRGEGAEEKIGSAAVAPRVGRLGRLAARAAAHVTIDP